MMHCDITEIYISSEIKKKKDYELKRWFINHNQLSIDFTILNWWTSKSNSLSPGDLSEWNPLQEREEKKRENDRERAGEWEREREEHVYLKILAYWSPLQLNTYI